MKRGNVRYCSATVIAIVMLSLGTASTGFADEALERKLQSVSSYLQNKHSPDTPATDKREIGFREQRFSDLLSEPAIFSGKLVYEPATRAMSKIVIQPERISMMLTEKAVVVESNAGKRRLSLRARPALRAILAGFRALLEGDIETLQSHFNLEYKNNNEKWELLLTPHSKRLARRLVSLAVNGKDKQVDNMVTIMQNGDRQELTFVPFATVNE